MKQVFPSSEEEFRHIFGTENACQMHLMRYRWRDGFKCPHCGSSNKHWEIKIPYGYECSFCQRRTSPTAGTAMHRSHMSLQNWFLAVYLTTQTNGINARKLAGKVGCSYKTALAMLKSIRDAIPKISQPRLQGDVDAGQDYIRSYSKKNGTTILAASTLVFCAVEWAIFTQSPIKHERICLAVAEKTCEESIMSFLRQNVVEGSNLLTHDWRDYSQAILKHYNPPSYPESPTFTLLALNSLKTSLHKVFRKVEPRYLQSYLDEIAFRYNRRWFTPENAFNDLLIALCEPPL
jgi:transposase-like protein